MPVDLHLLRSLADEWRQEADTFRRRGGEADARMAESYAADLEERLREWELEALPLQQAAEEANLSYSGAHKKLDRRDWPNVGKQGAPRVPRYAVLGYPQPDLRLETGEPDVAEKVLRERTGR